MSVIIVTYRTYWLGSDASNIFIFHIQSTSIIMIFYVQTLFIIIIHVGVHLGLSSIIIISQIWYASIIIITDVHLVIFHDGLWIVLGSITINENSIPPPHCRRATPSHKCAMIVASSLWLTFFDKIRGGAFSHQCWSGLLRCVIGFLLSWIPGKIGIPRHCPFAYVIIF